MLSNDLTLNGSKRPKPVENIVNKRKELEEIASTTLGYVIDSIGNKQIETLQRKEIIEQINDSLHSTLEEQNRHLSHPDKQKIVNTVVDEILGFGPITPLINDPTVTEIMVNGPQKIYVEREGKIYKTEITFRNDSHVMHIIDKIITPLGRRVDEGSPMVDARLPDGSRVNVIIPPLSVIGPSITVRKFATDPYTLEDLISFGTLTTEMAKFLRSCVRARTNIIVSGGTGSGKTTFLNVLSSFIPHSERIVTIEDAAELQLKQEHVVTLESRPSNIEGKGLVTIRDLVINSLRMRPDRIVVGEVRGGECLDMLQAMNTGHDGSITTVHANNPRDGLARLETMVMMAGMDLPLRAIREQVSSAIDLIIHSARFIDGTRKITKISEVVGMEGDTITIQDIFVFRQDGFDEKGNIIGKNIPTGIIPKFMEKFKAHGESTSTAVFKAVEETDNIWRTFK
ncbi:MAG: type II secretion system protein E [Desulfitibacter sp. BRH_c19]|nr:MAG: type II secretion system protein E [Desulfitibacter sp. BRH_c19]